MATATCLVACQAEGGSVNSGALVRALGAIAVEELLRALRPARAPLPLDVDEPLLARACQAVKRWLDEADESGRQLALDALQIAIIATPEQAILSGVLPVDV